MAYLIPADKGTHFYIGAHIVLIGLVLSTWQWAVAACVVAAVAREVYGWWKRHWRMDRYDALESAQDIGATLYGAAVVLAGYAIGVYGV